MHVKNGSKDLKRCRQISRRVRDTPSTLIGRIVGVMVGRWGSIGAQRSHPARRVPLRGCRYSCRCACSPRRPHLSCLTAAKFIAKPPRAAVPEGVQRASLLRSSKRLANDTDGVATDAPAPGRRLARGASPPFSPLRRSTIHHQDRVHGPPPRLCRPARPPAAEG